MLRVMLLGDGKTVRITDGKAAVDIDSESMTVSYSESPRSVPVELGCLRSEKSIYVGFAFWRGGSSQ